MRSFRILPIVAVVFVIGAQAQVPADRQGLLKSEGMGLATYAEGNGFPGPKHVLEMKDTLGLTLDQMKITEALIEGVQASARVVGEQIVEAEEALHSLFAVQRPVDRRDVQTALNEIGRLRAQLRYVHLDAHLQMKEILTPGQVRLYSILRGHGKTEKE